MSNQLFSIPFSTTRGTAAVLLGALLIGTAPLAQAGFELGVYGGFESHNDSDVTLEQGGATVSVDNVAWDEDTSNDAPYYGLRATFWGQNSPWGVMLDFTHARVKADLGGSAGETFDILEFTDGLNLVTANAVYRMGGEGARPYIGVGVGIAWPHVEVQTVAPPTDKTFEYQMTGFAAQGLAGVSFRISDSITGFAEYKLSYAQVDADLVTGGKLDTDVWSNHILFGIALTTR